MVLLAKHLDEVGNLQEIRAKRCSLRFNSFFFLLELLIASRTSWKITTRTVQELLEEEVNKALNKKVKQFFELEGGKLQVERRKSFSFRIKFLILKKSFECVYIKYSINLRTVRSF